MRIYSKTAARGPRQELPSRTALHAPFIPLHAHMTCTPCPSPTAGTAGLNVPMFIALRRFTLLFTILLERFWLKKSHDWPTLSAMGIMIGGEACRCSASVLWLG